MNLEEDMGTPEMQSSQSTIENILTILENFLSFSFLKPWSTFSSFFSVFLFTKNGLTTYSLPYILENMLQKDDASYCSA